MQFSESLKKYHQFQDVYKNGKSYANRYLIMYVKENGLAGNRIGISVSKKVGNSVVRHHVTRLVRESYRLQEEVFNSGLDCEAGRTGREKGTQTLIGAYLTGHKILRLL